MGAIDSCGAMEDTGATPVHRWRFVCLARIANFASLRRQLGCARSDRVAADAAFRVAEALPDASVTVAGRDLLEIRFDDDERTGSDARVVLIRRALAASPWSDGRTFSLDMRFGVAAAPLAQHDEIQLVEEAELALSGPDAGPDVVPSGQSALSAELPQAIARGELFLQFQPKLHLRRQEIAGVEALVRWDHPVRGLILPGDFIPAAEGSPHIAALTLWTLRQAITDQRALAARGHDVPVFLNISGLLLSDDAFVAATCAQLRDCGVKIGFEITETAVIRDPDAAIANLERIAELGVPISIDDYGAGLSSLAYLKRLPAHELKIDKLFITQLASSHRDPLIVRSTIDLAHALEMEVTAEGVEDAATLALLSVMGCDMAQGYLISRPLGLGALIQYLDEGRHSELAANPRATLGGLAAIWKRA